MDNDVLMQSLNEYYSRCGIDQICEMPEDGNLFIGKEYVDIEGEDFCIEMYFNVNDMCYREYVDGYLELEEPRKYINTVMDELKDNNMHEMLSECIDHAANSIRHN